MRQLSRTRTVLILSFLVIVWGVNWPLSKLALDYTPPLLFAGLRTVLGGIILLIFALPRYKQLRLRETWHLYLISAVLNINYLLRASNYWVRLYASWTLFSYSVYRAGLTWNLFMALAWRSHVWIKGHWINTRFCRCCNYKHRWFYRRYICYWNCPCTRIGNWLGIRNGICEENG